MNKIKVFLCLLCCGRIELLKETIETFKANCSDISNYDLHLIVSDDSGDSDLNHKIKSLIENSFPASKLYFRFGENIGQVGSYWYVSKLIDEVKIEDNDLVFMLEEDWKFVEKFSICDLSNRLNSFFSFQDQLINYCAVILKSDVDDFEKYIGYGYNIAKFTNDEITIAPPNLQFICNFKGNCVHNDIISFHPHLMKAKDVARYSKEYDLMSLIGLKQSAEKLLGKITNGLRTFIIDKVYAIHTGNYRIHSVFPGAKIRAGVSIVNINDYKRNLNV